jgi:hypothetical protein
LYSPRSLGFTCSGITDTIVRPAARPGKGPRRPQLGVLLARLVMQVESLIHFINLLLNGTRCGRHLMRAGRDEAAPGGTEDGRRFPRAFQTLSIAPVGSGP